MKFKYTMDRAQSTIFPTSIGNHYTSITVDPAEAHLSSLVTKRLHWLFGEECLPDNSGRPLLVVELLPAAERPLCQYFRESLSWFDLLVRCFQADELPPLFIIQQLAYLRTVFGYVFSTNKENVRRVMWVQRLSRYFPGISSYRNPAPSILSSYFSYGQKRRHQVNERRTLGIASMTDSSPPIVKAVVFHFVFDMLAAVHLNAFDTSFFREHRTLAHMLFTTFSRRDQKYSKYMLRVITETEEKDA